MDATGRTMCLATIRTWSRVFFDGTVSYIPPTGSRRNSTAKMATRIKPITQLGMDEIGESTVIRRSSHEP